MIRVSAQIPDGASVNRNLNLKNSFKQDTVQRVVYHSPKKAALFSAMLPGLGQVYNRKYWKVPLIYAAAGGLIYSFQFNQSRYVNYREAYKNSLNNVYTTPYNQDQLIMLYKYYHRYRDLTVIGFATLYLLNIVDASVDAHLFHFDVSDDLSINFHPTIVNIASIHQYAAAFSLTIGL